MQITADGSHDKDFSLNFDGGSLSDTANKKDRISSIVIIYGVHGEDKWYLMVWEYSTDDLADL